MSDSTQISVKDEESARAWLARVELINQDYRRAMQGASDALTSMTEFCEGTLVDDFVQFGSDLLTAAENTFTVMGQIAGTINTVIDTIKNFTDNVVSGIGNAVRNILG